MRNSYLTLAIILKYCNNKISKINRRTRHEHYPKVRYKKPINEQTEFDKLYDKDNNIDVSNIICLNDITLGSVFKKILSVNFDIDSEYS